MFSSSNSSERKLSLSSAILNEIVNKPMKKKIKRKFNRNKKRVKKSAPKSNQNYDSDNEKLVSILEEIDEELNSQEQISIEEEVEEVKNVAANIIVLDDSDDSESEDAKPDCFNEIPSVVIKEELNTETSGTEYSNVKIKLESTEEYCDYDYSQLLDKDHEIKPDCSIDSKQNIFTDLVCKKEDEWDRKDKPIIEEIEVTPDQLQYSKVAERIKEEKNDSAITIFPPDLSDKIKPADFNDVWFLQCTYSDEKPPIVMPVLQKVPEMQPSTSVNCDIPLPYSPNNQVKPEQLDAISIGSDSEDDLYNYPQTTVSSSEDPYTPNTYKRGRPALPVLEVGSINLKCLSTEEKAQYMRFKNNEASRNSRRIKRNKQLEIERLRRELEIENWTLTQKLKIYQAKNFDLQNLLIKVHRL